MSSYMDSEDSIPRPEYEDIEGDEDDEDSDEEFWTDKPQTNANALQNGGAHPKSASDVPASTSRSALTSSVTSSSNSKQSFISKDTDDTRQDVSDSEEEEISYDEADDETFTEEDKESSQPEKPAMQRIQSNDNAVKSSDPKVVGSNVIPSAAASPATLSSVPSSFANVSLSNATKSTISAVTSTTTTASLVTPSEATASNASSAPVPPQAGAATDAKTKPNKLVALMHSNGRVSLAGQSLPKVITVVTESPAVSPKEEEEEREKPSPNEKFAAQLNTNKDDQPRSSTPSGKGTREFLALQKSFSQSKVLSEFVSEKDRSRKTRKVPLKSSESINGDEADTEKFRICRGRSKSCTRTTILSTSSSRTSQRWPSDEKLNLSKRENMRSQNTDFVQKQMKFLKSVNHDATAEDIFSEPSDGEASLNESSKTTRSRESKDDCWQPPPKRGSDSFCWKCKKCSDLSACSKCPRSYHQKCSKVGSTVKLDKNWICPECTSLATCLNGPKKLKKEGLSVDALNQLLLFALKRMKEVKGHEKLLDVPDENLCPSYAKYVVNPVTLNSIQSKIEKKAFRCTEEFVLETKWIQHNVTIAYSAFNNKDCMVAKAVFKVCRQEAAEIETCSECYLNANTRKDWFVEVCQKPHILLWAKLKGFPYWPAKGMGLGPNSMVNVRFFGVHDRAFVPIKDCYLYSETDPNPPSGKRAYRPGIADCIKEVDVHIANIKTKVGAFNFAPAKMQYEPTIEMTQLEDMMPGVSEYIKRQMAIQKPPLTYKIVKTAGNSLSIIKKPDSGTDSDHSSKGAAERVAKNTRKSSENPSPVSEAKKAKDSESPPETIPPKATSISKTISSKNVSSNYEVVAKPLNKDESNSSKISSVILKRKSDLVLTSPSVKKSKSSEENPVKENPESGSTSPKHEAKLEDSKDSIEEIPAKRGRSSRSNEKSTPAPSPSQQAVSSTSTGEPLKRRSATQIQFKIQPKVQDQPKPEPTPKAEAASTSPKNRAEPSSVVSKFVQLRQGVSSNVTIKMISKKQPDVSPLSATAKDTAEEKSKTIVARVPESKPPQQKPSNWPSPRKIAAKPSPAPSIVKIDRTQKRRRSTPPPTVVAESVTTSKGLIPFEDIKLEKPEEEELMNAKTMPSTGKDVDPLATPNSTSNGNGNPTQSLSSGSNTPNAAVNPPRLPVDPELVKSENVSDEESSSNSTPTQEITNASPTPVNQANSRPIPPPRQVGETMIQRIVVRSLESLTKQPPQQKTPPPLSQNSGAASALTSTPPASTSAKAQTPNARARKSFPNKGPNPTTVVLPQDVKRSLTKNSMIYIPSDSQNNSVPLKPLTAVSKQANHNQVLVKVTCATTIPTPIAATNSGNIVTTTAAVVAPASSTASFSSAQAPPPAQVSPAAATITVSAAVTHSSTSVSASVTAVATSVSSHQSYVSTLKTLSPLQLIQTQSRADAPETSEANQDGDAHILSGIVTPSLAAAITDTIVRGPPRLVPRPNGALRGDGNLGFNSDAGPMCRTLMENAHKMTDFFISVMQDTVSDLANADVLPAKIAELQMELETKVAMYEKRLDELKQNTDTVLCEMKKSMETERMRIIAETRKQCEIERIHAVEQTKKRQWCTTCGREAKCYCCWNTAYCDTACQGLDWARHKPNCCQVNPHLNTEMQGPGVLFSAPTLISSCSTVTTPSVQTINSTTPGFVSVQPPQTFRVSAQSTAISRSTSSSATLSSSTATTSQATGASAAKKKGSDSHPQGNAAVAPASADMAYKGKEVLKLPSSTYLRALPSAVRLAAPPVHRFNIPLPIAAAASTGGPPYTLVHREGNWELMGTSHPPSSATVSVTSFPQATRIMSAVTSNLPPDSRNIASSAIIRPKQM